MDAIRYVQHRGVGVYIDMEGNLRAYPTNRLDPNLRTFIRDHRDAILATLAGRSVAPDMEITVGNILALSPEEREEYRHLIETTPDAHHDREAYRRAMDIVARRKESAA